MDSTCLVSAADHAKYFSDTPETYPWPMDDFVACDTCRAKPGSPALCLGCLHNRTVIGLLQKNAQRRSGAPDRRSKHERRFEATAGRRFGPADRRRS